MCKVILAVRGRWWQLQLCNGGPQDGKELYLSPLSSSPAFLICEGQRPASSSLPVMSSITASSLDLGVLDSLRSTRAMRIRLSTFHPNSSISFPLRELQYPKRLLLHVERKRATDKCRPPSTLSTPYRNRGDLVET